MTIPEYISAMLCAVGLMMITLRFCMADHRNTSRGGKCPYWCEYGASKTIGTREVQEDEYGILETQEGIMAVLADGMGKHYGGKIASRAAVEVFKDIFDDENAFYNPQYYLRKALQGANREILNLIEDGHGQACVAAVLIKDNRMYYASAGNVKIAVYRNKELVPVTEGHTISVLAKKQYTEGKLSRQDAAALMEHHRLYNYVGQDGFHDIEFFDTPIALNGGEYILLMSDGMYEEVRWKEMEDCLEQEGTCQQKAFALVELVNQSDSEDKDNASVAVLKIKGKK